MQLVAVALCTVQCGYCGLGHALCTAWFWALHYAQCGCCGLGLALWMLGPHSVNAVAYMYPFSTAHNLLVAGVDPGFSEGGGGGGGGGANGT